MAEIRPFLFLLWMLLIQETSGASFMGCKQDSLSMPSFSVIPPGIDPNSLTPSMCHGACENTGAKYSGLHEGRICQCSDDVSAMTDFEDEECSSTCSGDDSKDNHCGGEDHLYSVFDLSVAPTVIKGLKITLSDTEQNPTTSEVVNFAIALDIGTDVVYGMSYGDECPKGISNATDFNQHWFHLPGYYISMAEAYKKGSSDMEEEASVDFTVEMKLTSQNLIDCPLYVFQNEEFTCLVSILKGTSNELKYNSGDESEGQISDPEEPLINVLGSYCVPQVEGVLPISEDIPSNTDYVLPFNGEVPQPGFIFQFNAYVESETAQIEITIYRPKCDSPLEYCVYQEQCTESCPVSCENDERFDPYSGRCLGNGDAGSPATINYEPLHGPFIKEIDKKGHWIFNTDEMLEVMGGDIITFKMVKGNIGFVDAEEDESDKSSSDPKGEPWVILKKKHLFQALLSNPEPVVLSHAYKEANDYVFSIQLNNKVTEETVKNSTNIKVLEEITGFCAQPININKGTGEKKPGFGDNQLSFATNTDITFDIIKETGTIDGYFLEFENGTRSENYSKEADMILNFNKEGSYNISIYAYNAIQISEPCNIILKVMSVLQYVIVDDFGIFKDKEETKWFEVKLSKLPPEICVSINYNDDSAIETYGESDWCKENVTDGEYKGSMENPLNVTHIYKAQGEYEIKVIACTRDSCVDDKHQFVISKLPCKGKPDVMIENNATDPEFPVIWERSKGIRFTTVTIMDCSDLVTGKREWKIFRLDPDTFEEIEALDMNQWNGWKKPNFFVPKRSLEYGLYRVEFNIDFVENNENGDDFYERKKLEEETTEQHYKLSVSTYVKIVKSSLMPFIIRGAMGYVNRGYEQEVPLNAGILSIDPDYPDDNNFNVTWFCYRIAPEKDEIDTSSFNPSEYEMVDILPPTGNHVHEDKGGCFGTGPGFVNYTESNWVVKTEVFYKKNASYNVTAFITKDTRSASAWVVINIVNGIPPYIVISCLTGTMCKPTQRGLIINTSTRLALSGDCLKHCPEEMEYNWKMTAIDSDTGDKVDIDDINEYATTDHGGKEFGLNKTFFQTHPDLEMFAFELMVPGSEENGNAGVFLLLNKPPKPGTCNLETENGDSIVALFDRVKIKCQDWQDPDGNDIDRYKFYTIKIIEGRDGEEIEWEYLLSFRRCPKECEIEALLQCGKQKLYVDVIDQYESETTYFIKEVDVKSPDISQFEKFESSNWIRKLKEMGDQFILVQTLQARKSIFECLDIENPDLSDEERRTKEIKKLKQNNNALKAISDTVCLETTDDLVLATSGISTVMADGEDVDMKGRDITMDMVHGMSSVVDETDIEVPEDLFHLTKNVIMVVSAVVEGNTEVVKEGQTKPTDMDYIQYIDYDTQVEEDFVMPASPEEMRLQALRLSERDKSEQDVESISNLMNSITNKVLEATAINEDMVVLDTPLASASFAVFDNKTVSNVPVDLGRGGFHLPDVCVLLGNASGECDNSKSLGIASFSTSAILNTYGKQLGVLANNTETIIIDVFTDEEATKTEMKVENLTEPIDVIIPRKAGNGLPEPMVIVPKLKWFEYMMYHQIILDRDGLSVNMELQLEDTAANYLMYIRYDKKPKLHEYDVMINLRQEYETNDNNTYEFFFNNSFLGSRTGNFYVGIAQLNESVDYKNIIASRNVTKNEVVQNFTSSYVFRSYTSSCNYFDAFYKKWSNEGCEVFKATIESTHCKCNHLTTFAGGLVVAPNTIDFAYVFANASFTDNLTIYIAIILTFTIFIIFLIWARRKDKKDREKIGALPLPDNNPEHKYLYEILVFTGHARNASTDSKVSFVLSGDKDETDFRHFGSSKRKIFRRDGIDVFVMTTPRSLGQLQFMRIWHDNSGKGSMGSWYLNYIMVRDVQTGEKFEFIANCWFAVEEDDGEIDRVIPVAGREELTEFSHLFNTTSHKNIADNHLWFSVFLRPPRSRFTRCQRVCCCMSLLYLSMLVNAMWYGTVPEKPKGHGFKLGPMNLSIEQISVGFMSNLIVFPPSFLIIFLFRKSRPRKLRPSRITSALKSAHNNSKQPTTSQNKTKGPKPSNSNNGKIKQMFTRDKKFTLPWWCTIIAWILCIGCMLVSVFFLWAYGIQFGNDKTMKWITSLFISFFMSILITQPIKVFFMALLFSLICKKTETDEDDADEDEEDPELQYDEQWLDAPYGATRPKKAHKSALNPEEMEKAKLNREKELKTSAIIWEIIGYIMILWILSVMGLNSRDDKAFFLRRTLVNSFIESGFKEIKFVDDFWKWSNDVLLPNLRAQRTYNNDPPFGMKGFLRDEVNRMLGYAIIRQVRIKKTKCKLSPAMKSFMKVCTGGAATIDNEETANFGIGWNRSKEAVKMKGKTYEEDIVTYGPYRYRSSNELNGSLTLGYVGMYSGGGYVLELIGKLADLSNRLNDLKNEGWIDKYTRALFIEFSSFNAQVKLFGVVKMVVEVTAASSAIPFADIHSFKYTDYGSGLYGFLILCQILFFIWVLYSTVKLILNWCRNKCCTFCSQFWNWIEIIMMLCSYAAMIMFFVRYFSLNNAVDTFNKTKGNRYINIQFAQKMDEGYNCCISIVVFLAMVKFNKILRFNNRLTALSRTLKKSSGDLAGFFVFFAISLMAFGSLFYLYFSSKLFNFRNAISTSETMFSIMLNKFTFQLYMQAHPVVAPIVFFSFTLYTNIILINIFLSIIIGSFETIKKDIMKEPNQYDIVGFITKRFKGLLGMDNRKIMNKNNRLKMKANDDEHVNVAAKELPAKVDRLLDYINCVYFDGKLDLNTKDMMKMYKKKPHYLNPKSTYGDDNATVFLSN